MLDKLVKAIGIVLIAIISSSCTNLSKCSEAMIACVPVVKYLADSNISTIKIKSSKSTNEGTPFYVLIKATNFPTFLTDDYPNIAELIVNPPEDQTCFATCCIVPGQQQTVKIETPEDKSIAVYFLFTSPGDVWKQIILLEESCSTIKILLEGNEIISIDT